MGTPCGLSYSGATIGHCVIGVQKRELGWLESLEDRGPHAGHNAHRDDDVRGVRQLHS